MNFAKLVRPVAALFAATVLTVAASAQTSTWKIDSAHSGVEFRIVHLGVSHVNGSLSKITGNVLLGDKDVTKSSVEATIDATTVNTQNDARDKHLKSPDFFNVEKFPTLTFKSTSVSKAGGKLTLTGDLTLAGVTKPITLALDGPAAPQTDAKGVIRSGFSATGTLKRSDFGFGSKYTAPVLSDEVTFTIDIEMDKQ